MVWTSGEKQSFPEKKTKKKKKLFVTIGALMGIARKVRLESVLVVRLKAKTWVFVKQCLHV